MDEKHGPHISHIYGIKLKDAKLYVEAEATPDGSHSKMRLVKVGCIQTSSANKHSIMNGVMEEVTRTMEEVYGKVLNCSVLFVLPIDVLEPRDFPYVEEVRQKTGLAIPDNIGEALRLPAHTEWVVTTDEFISAVIEKINEIKIKAQQKNPPDPKQSTGKEPTSSNAKETKVVQDGGVDTPRSASSTELDDLSKGVKGLSIGSSTSDTKADYCTFDTKAVFGSENFQYDKHESWAKFSTLVPEFFKRYDQPEVKAILQTKVENGIRKQNFYLNFPVNKTSH